MSATNSIKIEVPKSVVVELLLERLAELGAPQRMARTAALPAIGAAYEGGIYAGVTVHDNVPHALVLLPGESAELKWADAMNWAQEARGELPSRFDALTIFTNLKSEFKPEWYWTSSQHASYESCAWMQSFDYGNQITSRKGYDYRARAVRRVAI